MPSTIVADFPAYQIIDMNLTVIEVSAEDSFVQEFVRPQVTKRHGVLYSAVKLGSVSIYARKHGDDEVEHIARAKANGHPLYYAYNLAVCLHNGPVVKQTKVLLKDGQLVRLDGTLLQVKYERDIYIHLVPVESVAAA